MMLYLVSGANGFVGRTLCELLIARGFRVRALLHHDALGPWHERVVCDLADGTVPVNACRGIDGIFHLAGIAHLRDQSSAQECLYQRINVDGTQALLDAAAVAGVSRFVYFSSIKAVAEPNGDCVDETWDGLPVDAYGRSKRAAESLVLSAAGLGMHVSVLRPTLVYGPGVKGNLRRMIDAVAAARFPPMPELGNRRSMVCVSDLSEAALTAMTSNTANGRVYIVADGADYSTRSLYLSICQAVGRKPPCWSLPLWFLRTGARLGDWLALITRRQVPFSSSELQRLCGSACFKPDRLCKELGWRPRYTFYDVVGEMVTPTNHRDAGRSQLPR
jgi:nucleoside-diphosphate-sugar epimerase